MSDTQIVAPASDLLKAQGLSALAIASAREAGPAFLRLARMGAQ